MVSIFLCLSFPLINEYVCDFIELNKFLGDARSECLKNGNFVLVNRENQDKLIIDCIRFFLLHYIAYIWEEN